MARNKQSVDLDFQPDTDINLPTPRIDDGTRAGIGSALYNLITTTLGQRYRFDQMLNVGNAYYEMRPSIEAVGSDIPYPNAPTVLTPLICTAVDEFASRTSGTVLVSRPITFRGNDTQASENQHTLEQFFNNEYTNKNWDESLDTCIHLGGRDGTSVIGVFWEEKTVERVYSVKEQQPDGTFKMVRKRMRTEEHRGVRLVPVEMRDFLVLPNEARSLEEADGLAHKIYMKEPQLQAMVRSGTLWEDAVERALLSLSPGQSDLYNDPQGVSTYTINNLLDIGDNAVSMADGIKMNRGPLRVWKIHTDLYDMDGDGVSEENVFWVHDQTQILLGWEPFQYEGGRPYFEYAPYPYPNRFYGAPIPWRLKPFQDEADAQQIARLEALDRIDNPVYTADENVKINESDRKLTGLNIIRVPTGVRDPIQLIQPPPYPEASLREQQMIQQQADRVVGAPQVGGLPNPGQQTAQGSGRVSARQAQYAAAAQSQQTNKVLQRTRRWMTKVFRYAHGLYKQYAPDQNEVVMQMEGGAQKVMIPREIFCLDYTVGVAGNGGPMDKDKAMENARGIYQELLSNPLVQGDLELLYNITVPLLEAHDVVDVSGYIGTRDQAKQKQQSQQAAQAAQQIASMQHDILNHTDVKSDKQPTNGRPPVHPPVGGNT